MDDANEPLSSGIPGLIVLPEGSESEWKVRLPSEDRIGPLLCAFANGVGGVLHVGVADDGRCVGVTAYAHILETLRRLAETRAAPPIDVSFVVFPLNRDGRSIVCCQVTASAVKPVQFVTRDGEEIVYLRDGDSTRKASDEEIRRLERSKPLRLKLWQLERVLMLVLFQERRLETEKLRKVLRCSEWRLGRMLGRLLRAGLIFGGLDGRWSLSPAGAAKARRWWKKAGSRLPV